MLCYTETEYNSYGMGALISHFTIVTVGGSPGLSPLIYMFQLFQLAFCVLGNKKRHSCNVEGVFLIF